MLNKKLFWIYIISALVYWLQGIEGLPVLALNLYLKEKLGFTPEKLMFISSIISLGWVIKIIYGYFIDNYLSKKIWILISLIGSIGCCLYFGLSPILSLIMIIIMASLGNITTAFRDVANDGIMCVEGKKTDNCSTIQAIQWISITLATICVGLGGGYIAQNFSYKIGYLCLIPFYILLILFLNKLHKEPIRKKQSLFKTICSYKQLFTNKTFLLSALFLFLYKFSPSFGTPLFYIQRDNWHWSAQWIGTLGAIISCFEILGAIVFYKICKKINIKKWLYISVFLGAITSLAYLYYKPYTAVVYGVLFSVIGMFVHLIVMSFLAQSTIKGKEATSFALLCGINNLSSGTLSSLTGAFLLPIVGLNYLIIISAGTSLLCLPLLRYIKIK